MSSMGVMPIPCPHFKITIVKRSQGQSAVAGAAYQSGERLFSEYDQKTKFYNKKKELVRAEIMLPSHASPGFADRATLWNAVEAVENQWNSQLARRIVQAFPVEVPKEQYFSMIKEFCQEQFVSKGMIADFAIHDKGDGNPHAHILLTLRAMDEHGRWLPKARKVYDLDENGERIQLPSGNWKCHKENTVDWNDQKYAEIWRHSWETITNRYLEAAGRPERVDLRSFERQGIQQIPTVHLGPAAHQMEKRGVETFLGNLNRDIRAANSLMQSIRSAIRGLQRWIADLNEKKQLLLDALEKAKEPMLSDLLVDYFNLRNEQRSDWSGKAKLKCTVRDFEEVKQAVDYRYNAVLDDIIIPTIFHALFDVTAIQKTEDRDVVLLREPKDAAYYEFSAKDDLVITNKYPGFTPDEVLKSFHADTYCFDSLPEKECFFQYIKSDKVQEVYFTEMFTSNQGDLSVYYYDPESGRIRQYYPDFLAKMKDGTYQLIEVKGDNKIDDVVVQAKKEAALEMAAASGIKYEMYAGSTIMKTHILEDLPVHQTSLLP